MTNLTYKWLAMISILGACGAESEEASVSSEPAEVVSDGVDDVDSIDADVEASGEESASGTPITVDAVEVEEAQEPVPEPEVAIDVHGGTEEAELVVADPAPVVGNEPVVEEPAAVPAEVETELSEQDALEALGYIQ